ncbi:MAG: hypothetical protein HZA50_14730 [Planctomycetes bacterium]|nr:hypothetical protein [Planctomycetota bacterium]
MIGIKIDKSMFFDRQKVLKAVDAGVRKVLSKFGAFVRTVARSSIRKRKAVSQPGQPPSSHTGLLKRLIYFGYDTSRKSVVIGPTPLRSEAEAPPLLEYGGRARRKNRKGKTVIATYRARAFMGPAFEEEKKKLPELWQNSIR